MEQRSSRRFTAVVCFALLIVHLGLLVNLALEWSPTPDENAHLAAGLLIWQHGRFDLYCVNPPITKLLAAFPAYLIGTKQDWADLEYDLQDRPEFTCGIQLVTSHPRRWRSFLVGGRMMLIPFSVVGALVCFQWAKHLYGIRSAVVALTLWCFSPSVLTWNAVVCSDGLAASFGVAAGFSFWHWLRHPTILRALLAGVLLGCAQLAKMSLVILFPVWILLWVMCHRCYARHPVKEQVLQLIGIQLLAVYVLNVGYAWDGSLKHLCDYHFLSRTFAADNSIIDGAPGGNRFAASPYGCVRVPLPEFYLKGIDLQKVDFEKGMPSYLCGKWSQKGWWYYYLIGLLIKTQVGVLALAMVAACGAAVSLLSQRRGHQCPTGPTSVRSWKEAVADHAVLIVPAVSLLVFVSAQDGFSRHLRYVLPIMPFVFIWISQVGRVFAYHRPIRSMFVGALLVESIYSSMVVYPHTISYFNSVVGGPERGHRYLLDSSFSWWQDTFYLKNWLAEQDERDLPFVTISTKIPIEAFGILHRGVSPSYNWRTSYRQEDLFGPVPGLHAVEVQCVLEPDSGFNYFSEFEPIARVGYSIWIYRITLEDANRVRRKLRLAPLEHDGASKEQIVRRLSAGSRRREPLHVAVYSEHGDADTNSEAASEVIACFKALPRGSSWETIDATAIVKGQLDKYDAIVVPGGSASRQAASLGATGKEAVRDYVRSGGGYLGICAGAHLGSSTFDWGLSLVNVQSHTGTCFVPGMGEQMWLDRGSGDVRVSMSAAGAQVFGDTVMQPFLVTFTGGPVFQPGRRTYLGEVVNLAHYASETYQYEFQEGTMIGTPAVIGGRYGKGNVMLVSPHFEFKPEFGAVVASAIKAVARFP